MKQSLKLKLITLMIATFSALFMVLFCNVLVGLKAESIENENMVLTINEGKEYLSNSKIDIYVDAQKTPEAVYARVEMCLISNDGGDICTNIQQGNKYRYTLDSNKKLSKELDLKWIIEDNPGTRIYTDGNRFRIKVILEKNLIFGIPSNKSLGSAQTVLVYSPLRGSDIRITKDGKSISSQNIIKDLDDFELEIDRINQIYNLKVNNIELSYCKVDDINEECGEGTLKKITNMSKPGSFRINNLDKDIEGRYKIIAVVTLDDSSLIMANFYFTYDLSAPRVTLTNRNSNKLSRQVTFDVTIKDASTYEAFYKIVKAGENRPSITDLTEKVTSNEIVINEISGNYTLYLLAYDVYDNGHSEDAMISADFSIDNSAPNLSNAVSTQVNYNKKTISIQISKEKIIDQIQNRDNFRYFFRFAGTDLAEEITINQEISIEEFLKEKIDSVSFEIYAIDSLGNSGRDNPLTVTVPLEVSNVSISLLDGYKEYSTLKDIKFMVKGTSVKEIFVNGTNYINRPDVCNFIEDETSYECSVSGYGIHTVKAKDSDGYQATLQFINAKDGIWNIDGEDIKLDKAFLVFATIDERRVITNLSMPAAEYDENMVLNLLVAPYGSNQYKSVGAVNLSNKDYNDIRVNIKADYILSSKELGKSYLVGYLTEASDAPSVTIEGINPSDTSMSFTLSIIDVKKVLNIELIGLYIDNKLVAKLDILDNRDFYNLDPNTTYRLVISYNYDLNDGSGVQKCCIEQEFTTLETVVENPEKNPDQDELVGNVTSNSNHKKSLKDFINLKNILILAIVIITAVYLIKFFKYKKNIKTV